MKYIYFEIHMISDGSKWVGEPEIKNENILVLKPYTNSNGNWGFRHWTDRYGPPGKDGKAPIKDMLIVDQNWIDMDKYKLEDQVKPKGYRELAEQVREVLTKLKKAQDER